MPRIEEWGEHRYWYVPGVLKVTDADWPSDKSPVSKPVPVAECCAVSLLVHVTVPPTCTRTTASTKVNPLMSTATDDGGGGGEVGGGPVVAGGAGSGPGA